MRRVRAFAGSAYASTGNGNGAFHAACTTSQCCRYVAPRCAALRDRVDIRVRTEVRKSAGTSGRYASASYATAARQRSGAEVCVQARGCVKMRDMIARRAAQICCSARDPQPISSNTVTSNASINTIQK